MSTSPRRRQRSRRVLVASVLLAIAVIVVATAVVTGPELFLVLAGVASIVLGAVASRIVYLELLDSRRDAAADRAALAQDYRAITADRVRQNASFIETMTTRVERSEATVVKLEERLTDATADLIETRRQLQATTLRAEGAETRATTSAAEVAALKDAEVEAERVVSALRTELVALEQRATASALRITELETELEAATAWQQAAPEKARKHA